MNIVWWTTLRLETTTMTNVPVMLVAPSNSPDGHHRSLMANVASCSHPHHLFLALTTSCLLIIQTADHHLKTSLSSSIDARIIVYY